MPRVQNRYAKMSFLNGSVTVVKGSLPMFLPKLTTDLFSTNGFTTPLSFQILYQNRPFPGPSSPGASVSKRG